MMFPDVPSNFKQPRVLWQTLPAFSPFIFTGSVLYLKFIFNCVYARTLCLCVCVRGCVYVYMTTGAHGLKGIRIPGTGGTGTVIYLVGCWELIWGHLE